MSDLYEQFKKTPWLVVRVNGTDILCTICKETINVLPEESVGCDIDRLIKFGVNHEKCGSKKE